MSLGSRLDCLANFYLDQEVIWDIGCDHGSLGLSLIGATDLREINLVDPSVPVIKELKRKIKDSYITKPGLKVNLINKKGQEITIKNDLKKIIFIAGMGGKEILEMLKIFQNEMSLTDLIVISPHKNILEVRSFLASSHFNLYKEVLVQESNRFYQVIGLTLCGDYSKVHPFGSTIWESDHAQRYRQHLIKHLGAHQDQQTQEFMIFLNKLSI